MSVDEQWINGIEALASSASVPYIHCCHKLTPHDPHAADPCLCQACKLPDMRQTDHDLYFISVVLDTIKSIMVLGKKKRKYLMNSVLLNRHVYCIYACNVSAPALWASRCCFSLILAILMGLWLPARENFGREWDWSVAPHFLPHLKLPVVGLSH